MNLGNVLTKNPEDKFDCKYFQYKNTMNVNIMNVIMEYNSSYDDNWKNSKVLSVHLK